MTMTSFFSTPNKEFRKFESLDTWKQLKKKGNSLPWYFAVSINSMPAKYVICKSISCSVKDLKLASEQELWEEYIKLTRIFLDKW
jgi:putative pyruvate formate lyase activating enzyme